MIGMKYLLLGLLGISPYFTSDTVAREAIVGGLKAGNAFKYHVYVYIPEHDRGCGGGIIHNKYILTAADCVVAYGVRPIITNISVIAGTNDLDQSSEKYKNHKLVRHVVKVFWPFAYSHGVVGDIAILELNVPLQRPAWILNLPTIEYDHFNNKTAQIAGFGWHTTFLNHDSKPTGGRNDLQLRYIQARVLPNNECQRKNPPLTLTGRHICAQTKQFNNVRTHGVCGGDEGGSLVVNGTVIGVLVKEARNCDEKNSPAIYTRVSPYVDLLNRVLNHYGGISTLMYVHSFVH